MRMPWEIAEASTRRQMETLPQALPARVNPYRPRALMRTEGYSKAEEAGLELARTLGITVREPPFDARSKNLYRRRLRLFFVQRGLCYWCQKTMELDPKKPNLHGRPKDNQAFASFEHLIPKSHGGLRGVVNIVLAHAVCNNRRHRRKWPHDPVFGAGEPPVIKMHWGP